MLKPLTHSPTHEDLFIERYERLIAWSLQLTGSHRSSAEDLVHDSFVQFTLKRPPLESIENIEGYLRTMLRNLHISQMRRAAQRPFNNLSAIDYDSAEISLDAKTLNEIAFHDELRKICRYACQRKETSKAGSVLILRFFHGYYPSEINQILRSTRRAVDDWLMIARREAKLYLEDPRRLKFMSVEQPSHPVPNVTAGDLLYELRSFIYSSCQGECSSVDQLSQFYHSTDQASSDQAFIGHIVSCRRCLDEVNKMLDLPPLSERNPTDMAGKDKPSKWDKGGPPGGGGSVEDLQRKSRRRLRDVFEHKPLELHIAVNGFLVGSQKISSEISEQTLSINVDEKIGFVEVFSEQGLRLLFFHAGPPPEGAVKQFERISLSDGRTLELALNFSTAWPTLSIIYIDPSLGARGRKQAQFIGAETTSPPSSPGAFKNPFYKPFYERFISFASRLKGSLRNPNLWLRPSTVTVLTALIITAALLAIRIPVTVVSASELMRRATLAEEVTESKAGLTSHRVIDFVERQPPEGATISRRRIEVWQTPEKGVRRLYDEQGQILAGEWTADGMRTTYRRYAKPRKQLATEEAPPLSRLSVPDEIWLFEPTVKNFNLLIKSVERASVEEDAASYVVSYQEEPTAHAKGLVQAKLVLDKESLRPIKQLLFVQQGNGLREYQFIESKFEQRSSGTVMPGVFEPESELVGAVNELPESVKGEDKKALATESKAIGSSLIPSNAATAQLEVEVLNLLAEIGADLGEEVHVSREEGAVLKVEAAVETEARKVEILTKLKPVLHHSAINIKIQTVAEALRQASQKSPPSAIAVTRELEKTDNSIPVDAEIRQFLLRRQSPSDKIDVEVSRFANQMVRQSRRVVLHLWALRNMVNRFSLEDLRTLDADARAKWLMMIRKHAKGFQGESLKLRQELGPVFDSASPSVQPSTVTQITDDTSLIRAVLQLVELGTANDEIIRSAFTISGSTAKGAAVKSSHFWQSLNNAQSLAMQIERASQEIEK